MPKPSKVSGYILLGVFLSAVGAVLSQCKSWSSSSSSSLTRNRVSPIGRSVSGGAHAFSISRCADLSPQGMQHAMCGCFSGVNGAPSSCRPQPQAWWFGPWQLTSLPSPPASASGHCGSWVPHIPATFFPGRGVWHSRLDGPGSPPTGVRRVKRVRRVSWDEHSGLLSRDAAGGSLKAAQDCRLTHPHRLGNGRPRK